jgi:hypothetical protein
MKKVKVRVVLDYLVYSQNILKKTFSILTSRLKQNKLSFIVLLYTFYDSNGILYSFIQTVNVKDILRAFLNLGMLHLAGLLVTLMRMLYYHKHVLNLLLWFCHHAP